MYIFDFDSETNGIELSWRDPSGEISRREACPVYAGEGSLEAKIDAFRDDGCPLFE